MENKPKLEQIVTFQNPKEVLEHAVEQTRGLKILADNLLTINNDSDGYLEKLTARAQLVADLPARINKVLEDENDFPKDSMRRLNELSEMAKKLIETKNRYGLSNLLTYKESMVGDPNMLEELFNELYPSSKK